ncbi:ShlB/FhaC/HecB family hemolysin secretion/activation protein [Vibrio genomosp. F10 str. 9ZC157]|nr:ShlB/FhaC/HecB family hemolysin secretion/activation protein [Vibrio genomosp. F10]
MFPLYTATAADNAKYSAITPQEAISNQRQEFQKYEYQNREEKRLYTPGTQQPEHFDKDNHSNDYRCLAASQIRIENSAFIPLPTQREWQKTIDGAECFSLAILRSILNEISSFYIREGMITSHALQPYQDKDGIIVIPVVEGKIDELISDEQTSLMLPMVYPDAENRVFNMRDLEQALDQINRLRTYDYTSYLKPGRAFGTSTIKFKPTDKHDDHHYFGGVGYSKYSRIGSFNVSLGYDNPFGIVDSLYLSLSREKPNQSQKSRSADLVYSVPYGYSTFTLSQYISKSESNILLGSGATALYEFSSQRSSLDMSTLHYRDQTQTVSSSFALKYTDNRAEFGNQKLETSSERITYLDFGVDYVRRGSGHFFTSGFGVDMGLPDQFGTKERSGNLPDATYKKVYFTTSYLTLLNIGLHFRSHFIGQYSEDRLPGFKKVSIGGFYSVRGFKQYSYAGNTGGFIRNDLTKELSLWFDDMQSNKLVFSVDAGMIISDDQGSKRTQLVGTNIGWRTSIYDVSAQLDVGWSLYNNRADAPKDSPFIMGQVAYHF